MFRRGCSTMPSALLRVESGPASAWSPGLVAAARRELRRGRRHARDPDHGNAPAGRLREKGSSGVTGGLPSRPGRWRIRRAWLRAPGLSSMTLRWPRWREKRRCRWALGRSGRATLRFGHRRVGGAPRVSARLGPFALAETLTTATDRVGSLGGGVPRFWGMGWAASPMCGRRLCLSMQPR